MFMVKIDPCGWKKKPLGGLARKATVIENLKSQGLNPIILDAGDLLFKKNIIDPGVTTDVAKVNAEIIIDSFNKMGCDAFSLGSKDFAGGLDFVLEQYKKSNFPFLSYRHHRMGIVWQTRTNTYFRIGRLWEDDHYK